MTLLQLRADDARVVFLATVYHLGRPGSELDPTTFQRHDVGLQGVHDALLPQLDAAVAEVEATPYQVTRLAEALLGVANELKQFAIAGGRSAVPRFAETVRSLYPEVAEDPSIAMDLVQHPVMLRQRMAGAIADARAAIEAAEQQAQAARQAERRGWWQRLASLLGRRGAAG
jgi:hypothetical protein